MLALPDLPVFSIPSVAFLLCPHMSIRAVFFRSAVAFGLGASGSPIMNYVKIGQLIKGEQPLVGVHK